MPPPSFLTLGPRFRTTRRFLRAFFTAAFFTDLGPRVFMFSLRRARGGAKKICRYHAGGGPHNLRHSNGGERDTGNHIVVRLGQP
jgi:hypothetical protein